MARTFEYVLHFVECDTVTVSPNQIIIIIVRDMLHTGACAIAALLTCLHLQIQHRFLQEHETNSSQRLETSDNIVQTGSKLIDFQPFSVVVGIKGGCSRHKQISTSHLKLFCHARLNSDGSANQGIDIASVS